MGLGRLGDKILDTRAAAAGPAAGLGIVETYLARLHEDLSGLGSGEVATYIPELGRADPELFGICIATTDGQLYTIGDADHEVTIQSVSKPFMYAAALETHGRDRVLDQVGVEPTGETFNAIVLDEDTNRPFNPMVNAGAIATAELMCGPDPASAAEEMRRYFSRFAGRELSIDEAVFRSEHETGHRNRAITWLMLNSGMIERDPDEVLDLYFRQCSVLVSARDLAVMAATLAAHGTNPMTGDQVAAPDTVRDVLSVMSSAGMYDYAGQWAFDVGLPAKSGVSGLVAAVVPGQLGIAVYAPRLDPVGNSVRGVEACRRFADRFGLHVFGERSDPGQVIRRAYTAAQVQSRHVRDPREVDVLRQEGGRFAVLELQGMLSFGAVERVLRRMREMPDAVETVALDCRRVAMVDAGGLELLRQIMTVGRGPRLLLAEVAHRPALQPLADLAAEPGAEGLVELVGDVDGALEAFEDAVIAEAGAQADAGRFTLAEQDIFARLDADEIAAMETVAAVLSYDPEQVIVQTGDEAQAFFVVAQGTVSICVELGEGRRRRVASIGPGQVIGEMALLDGGPRSATAIADGKVMCYAFTVAAITEMSDRHPRIMEKILGSIVHSLSLRLRRANAELQALE